MTDSLVSWAGDFGLPYFTISYATGQWYETEMWQIYHARKPRRSPDLLRVMMDASPEGAPWTIFTAGRGGTWDNWDNHILGWIGNHLGEASLYALASIGVLVAFVLVASRMSRRRNGQARAGGWKRMRILG